MEKKRVNLLFDRTFFTEEIYSRLKFKEYDFSDVYEELVYEFSKLDFDIYYINLYLKDTNLYKMRLKRSGKAITEYAKFNIESSINQQEQYLKMANELSKKYNTIKVFNVSNDTDEETLKSKIKEILNF